MKEELILVDEQDVVIGTAEKNDAHRKGLLHRAFSLFIFDTSTQKLLLQQRALDKYHSGGLWTNSCCSHPRKNETTIDSVLRRTREELGINIPPKDVINHNLREVGTFRYYKDFGNCAEHEIDHVFIWTTSSKATQINPNKEEVENIKWISIIALEDWMERQPEDFTVWFFKAFTIFKNAIIYNNGLYLAE